MKNQKSTNSIFLAKKENLEEIMHYIDIEWKSGHILARDKKFFVYQYANADGFNFVLSKNSDGQIIGMLGFIKASAKNDSDVWTTMWKVSKNSGNPVLGMQLLEYLRRQGCRTVMSSGINPKTIGIYKYLGFATEALRQYFLLNNCIHTFSIAVIPNEEKQKIRILKKDSRYVLKKITSEELKEAFPFTDYEFRVPYKDWVYFHARYFSHPVYSYEVYGIFFVSKLVSILVTRTVYVGSSSALRIVDLYGDESSFVFATCFLENIMIDNGCEYIDMVCFGIDEDIMLQSGFSEVDFDASEIIIPNYFEPFVEKNNQIHFFIDSQLNNNVRIFKADGDQDRPNWRREHR